MLPNVPEVPRIFPADSFAHLTSRAYDPSSWCSGYGQQLGPFAREVESAPQQVPTTSAPPSKRAPRRKSFFDPRGRRPIDGVRAPPQCREPLSSR